MSTRKKINVDDFIRGWWKRRFPEAKRPEWNSAITCADAADLLEKFRKRVIEGSR